MYYNMFRREEKQTLEQDIKSCSALVAKTHLVKEVRLHPSVVKPAIPGLPILSDKYVPPAEIWVGWEKE